MKRFRLSAVLCLVAAASACAERHPCEDCNVLMISVDTLRRDHVSAHGHAVRTTPALDAFFSRGTVFERATSPSPCTQPAVSQVLTGRLDHADSAPTLAERLGRAGYRTAAIVSQHFFRDAQGPVGRYARGYETFDVQTPAEHDRHGMSDRRADAVTDRALAWLRTHGRDRPFHLWLHYFDPHDPYDPPASATDLGALPDLVASGDRRAVLCAGQRRTRAGCESTEGETRLFSAVEVASLVTRYDAEIRFTDAQIGRVLDALGELGLRDSTLVVFWSDHGERLGEDGRWDHCQSTEPREIDVPLMFAVGGGPLGARSRAPEPVSTLDIVPTLLELVGATDPAGPLDGVSLASPRPDRVVWSVWRDQRVAQHGPWKLYVQGRSARLYNVDADPAERIEMSHRRPEVARRLFGMVQDAADRLEPAGERSRQIVEELRALGYIVEKDDASGDPALRRGLTAAYYMNAEWKGEPHAQGIDPQVDFDWQRPPWPFPPPFSIEWNGALEIDRDGDYAFELESDDGSILEIGGQVVVDNGGDHGIQKRQGSVWLSEGAHRVRLRYFNRLFGGVMRFRWKPPGGSLEPVPSRVLMPLASAPEPLRAETE